MGYLAAACERGVVSGKATWGEHDILEWEVRGQVFKLRRSNHENEMPRKSGSAKSSESHNANQGLLFDIRDFDIEERELHWLVCSGFHNGPNLLDPHDGNFFVWTAPFLVDVDSMVGNRQMMFSGPAVDVLGGFSDENKSGLEISKPPLSKREKEDIIEDSIKSASNGH